MRGLRALFGFAVVTSVFAMVPRAAYAGDAGDAGDDASAEAGDTTDASDDGGADGGSEGGAAATPVACDGSLCDTTNGSTCAASAPLGNTRFDDLRVLGAGSALLGALAVGIARRRRRTGELKP